MQEPETSSQDRSVDSVAQGQQGEQSVGHQGLVKGLVPLVGILVLFLSLPFFIFGWFARDLLGPKNGHNPSNQAALSATNQEHLAPLRESLEKSFDQVFPERVTSELAGSNFPTIDLSEFPKVPAGDILQDIENLKLQGMTVIEWGESPGGEREILLRPQSETQKRKLREIIKKYFEKIKFDSDLYMTYDQLIIRYNTENY